MYGNLEQPEPVHLDDAPVRSIGYPMEVGRGSGLGGVGGVADRADVLGEQADHRAATFSERFAYRSLDRIDDDAVRVALAGPVVRFRP